MCTVHLQLRAVPAARRTADRRPRRPDIKVMLIMGDGVLVSRRPGRRTFRLHPTMAINAQDTSPQTSAQAQRKRRPRIAVVRRTLAALARFAAVSAFTRRYTRENRSTNDMPMA